jgi:hypothetical protein
MAFSYDKNGVYKQLSDGRVLRVEKRMYNSILTLSSSQEDMGWEHGW